MQTPKLKPINYNKLRVAELTALLQSRSLSTASTKLQMISRLVGQDAEELAAEKAAAKAFQEAIPSATESLKHGGRGGKKVKKDNSARARGGGAQKSVYKDEEVEAIRVATGEGEGEGKDENVNVSVDAGLEDVDATNKNDTVTPPVSEYIVKQMMATLASKREDLDAASSAAIHPDDIVINMTPAICTAPATPSRRRRLRHSARHRKNPGPSPLSNITALDTETGHDNTTSTAIPAPSSPHDSASPSLSFLIADSETAKETRDREQPQQACHAVVQRRLDLGLLVCVFFFVTGIGLAMGARWSRKNQGLHDAEGDGGNVV